MMNKFNHQFVAQAMLDVVSDQSAFFGRQAPLLSAIEFQPTTAMQRSMSDAPATDHVGKQRPLLLAILALLSPSFQMELQSAQGIRDAIMPLCSSQPPQGRQGVQSANHTLAS